MIVDAYRPDHRPRRVDVGVAASAALVAVLTLVAGACASDPAPTADPAAYRAEMSTICIAGSAARAAIAEPSDDSGVADFAATVADTLDIEADSARALEVPDDLDDDHRAFVQNTADQSSRWTELAKTPPGSEQFGVLQTEILELTLGRDDLSTAMGIDDCRITDQ